MRQKIHLFFTILILNLLVFLPNAYAGGKAEVNVYKLCKSAQAPAKRLYQDPTIHSRIVAKLSSNARWIVKRKGNKKYSHSTWQKVSWNKNTGWLKNSCLELDKNTSDIATRNPGCLKRKTRTKDCDKGKKSEVTSK